MTNPTNADAITTGAAKPADKKKPATKKKAPVKKIDGEQLRKCAAMIDELANTHLDQLIHQLEVQAKLKLVEKDGRVKAAMAGVTTSPAPNARTALLNWASAARRTLLKGGAA